MLVRESYLNWLVEAKDMPLVKVLTGIRRAGKSVILSQYKDYLLSAGVKNENILFFNFEHPDNFKYISSEALYEDILQKTEALKGKIYFLFDEIQEVNSWQKLINGLRVKFDADIYITGSNATLLSGELATYLAGRYIELCVYPLSFKEFVSLKNMQETSVDNEKLFQEYMQWGGFASLDTLPTDQLKRDMLDGIYTSIIVKDIASRGEIREVNLLDRLIAYLLDVLGSKVSIKKISDAIKASGYNTNPTSIDRYIGLLKQAFVFYEVGRYDIKGKAYLSTQSKYYVADMGIRSTRLGRIGNLGYQLENIIFLELKRRGYDIFIGKLDDTEIDFVCFKNGETKYFQVAYQLPTDSLREQRSLLHIKDNYEKTIITLNRMDVGEVEGMPIVYAIDWLLGA